MSTSGSEFVVSHTVVAQHAGAVSALVAAAGNFSAAEIDIARELVEEHLHKGNASGYEFAFLHHGLQLAGYTCYGPISGTERRFHMYWVAVAPSFQRLGLGRWLIAHTEYLIRLRGGVKVYIETSSRDNYTAARGAYERCGYRLDARLKDYYRDGDDNCIYSKVII